MLWYEILIEIIIGVLSGIIASYITNHFIEKRINKKVAYREKINELYTFLCFLEGKECLISINEVEEFLLKARKVFSADIKLKQLFSPVEVDLYSFVRIIKNGGHASISFDNENYLKLKDEMKKYFKENI